MKKGKKYMIGLLLSLGLLLSVITPTLLPCYADGVLTAIGIIDTVEKGIKYTMLIGDVLTSENPLETAVMESGHGQLVGATVDQSLTNYLGAAECKIASYTFLYGKYMYKYTDTNAVNRELLVTCGMYYTNSTPTNQSETYPERVITGADGLKYLTNNIYFTIYRDDGYYKRYRYQCHSDMIFTQQFATGTWSGSTGCLTPNGVTIHRDSNSDYYDVSDGSLLGTNTGWGGSARDITFTMSQNNTIVFNGIGGSYNSTTYTRYSYQQLDSSWGTYPEDKEICYCYLSNCREQNPSSASNRYVVPKFILNYFDTNDYGNERYYMTNHGGRNSNTFIYNYDNSYQADTIINNNNKTTVFDGTLANAFDVDGNVIMPIDLEADIMPLINAGVTNLSTKLDDFFDDMPDFGDLWSNRNTDNNYFDLTTPLPPDNPSGDITVLVTVDVSRPLVPEFTTSSRWLYIDVGNMTTTVQAIQPEYVAAAQTLQGKNDSVFNELELIPLYLGLAIFGVAVSVLFKGV